MEKKEISSMLRIVKGNIVDSNNWENGYIDTIVNAAKPTLMGSNQGVDGALHRAMDRFIGGTGKWNEYICQELGVLKKDNKILCNRGMAVTTKGHGYCKWIIHTVGCMYDGPFDNSGEPINGKECTSSCVNLIESCYLEVMREIAKHLDIETVGIPIIGSGEYRFPFKLAVKIAISSIGNALIEWKKRDEELFEMSKLKEIKIFIFDSNHQKQECNFICAKEILEEYKKYFDKEKRAVFQSTCEAHFRYINEILKYDTKRGYFAIARAFRYLLMAVRTLFIPCLYLKDALAKADWEGRRQTVEIITTLKIFLPILFWYILQFTTGYFWKNLQIEYLLRCVFTVIIIYSMTDTITYLLTLIFMADIQRPSANLARSIILLFINYIETACDLAFLYYLYYRSVSVKFHFREALAFGFVGVSAIEKYSTWMDYMFLYLNEGLKFYFLTLVLGYFFNHLRLRDFRS